MSLILDIRLPINAMSTEKISTIEGRWWLCLKTLDERHEAFICKSLNARPAIEVIHAALEVIDISDAS
jgi:hypothetical protein